MSVNGCYHGGMSTSALPVIEATASCEPLTRDPLSPSQADDLARALKAIADPARLRLISMIAASADHEACVGDLTDMLDVGQPTVSHHLKVLTAGGFIARSKRGTSAFYTLVPGALDSLSRLLVT